MRKCLEKLFGEIKTERVEACWNLGLQTQEKKKKKKETRSWCKHQDKSQIEPKFPIIIIRNKFKKLIKKLFLYVF